MEVFQEGEKLWLIQEKDIMMAFEPGE